MYKVRVAKLGGRKKKQTKKLTSTPLRKQVAKPIPVKNRQKRNSFEIEEKKKIASMIFDPFEISDSQRDGKSNDEIFKLLEHHLRGHFGKMGKSKQHGGSFFKKAMSGISNIINRVKTTFTGRDQLPPTARKVVEQHGNEKITSIVVHREPIMSVINKMINLLSFGKQEFDTLFHLYMIVTTDKGTHIRVEKNHVISITTNIKASHKDDQDLNIPVTKAVTLVELLEKTKQFMGSNFLLYSSKNNNCQHFVDSILSANGLNSSSAKKFVNQDPEQIFKSLPKGMSSLMDKVTGLASHGDVLLSGVG